MSKHDFTLDEFGTRRSRARERMAIAGLDWLIVIHPAAIHWLTGSEAKSYQEFQCLLLSAAEGPITVFCRHGEVDEYRDDAWVDRVVGWGGGEPEDPLAALAPLVESLGLLGARVGVEVPAYYLHPYQYLGLRELLGASLAAEPTHLIRELAMVKSPAELSCIREAARQADLAMKRFADALTVGKSELELAGEVYHSLLTNGSGIAASPINLVSGERSCFSHGAPTERRLRYGDFGSIEYGAAYKRYTATIGRQFCLGAPSVRMRELYGLVLEASDAAIAEIRAGVPAVVPHEAAKEIITRAGLDHGRVHLSGYGLGPGFPPTWSEPVQLFGGNPYTLEAGMVVTIEPPIFLGEEKLGARLIDNVLVTETGTERLTLFPRDLLVVDDQCT